jgi:hypothetical protein
MTGTYAVQKNGLNKATELKLSCPQETRGLPADAHWFQRAAAQLQDPAEVGRIAEPTVMTR